MVLPCWNTVCILHASACAQFWTRPCIQSNPACPWVRMMRQRAAASQGASSWPSSLSFSASCTKSLSPRWDNGWTNGLERAVSLNNSGFSCHSVFTPSSKQYMLWSELDIGLGYIFATVTHLDIMYMILNTQDGLVNLGLFWQPYSWGRKQGPGSGSLCSLFPGEYIRNPFEIHISNTKRRL